MMELKSSIPHDRDIKDHYIINENTNIILPAKQINYDSIVLEGDNVYPVRQTPLEIVKYTMKKNGIHFESRKKSCDLYFDYAYKLPISLSDVMFLIAFPTRGIDHFECIWIIERNVKKITKQRDVRAITFKNNHSVNIDIRFSILKNQYKKARDLNNLVFMNFRNLQRRFNEGHEGYR